jgi:hypothetical protein
MKRESTMCGFMIQIMVSRASLLYHGSWIEGQHVIMSLPLTKPITEV